MVVDQIFDKLWAYKLPNAAAGPDSRYPDPLTIFGIYQQKHKLRQFHVQEIYYGQYYVYIMTINSKTFFFRASLGVS